MSAEVFYRPTGADRCLSVPAATPLPHGAVVIGMFDGSDYHPADPAAPEPFEVAAARDRAAERDSDVQSQFELLDVPVIDGRTVVVATGDVLGTVATLAHRFPSSQVCIAGRTATPTAVNVCGTGSPLWEHTIGSHQPRPGPGYQWVAYGPSTETRHLVTSTVAVLNALVAAPDGHIDVGTIVAAATGLDSDDVWAAVLDAVSPPVAAWLVHNDATPAEVLDALACRPDSRTRTAVASHRATSQHTLDVLADDEEVTVRMAVASNRSTSTATLTELALDSSPLVVWAVVNNPEAPVDVVEKISAGEGTLAAFAARRLSERPRPLPPDLGAVSE